MSILGTLMSKIFGRGEPAPVPGPAAAPAAPTAVATPVDIEAVLQEMAAKASQQLNWRTSIVDLMKLVGMDSSLAERQKLAKELGYTGNPQDSATMNIWLHKQVMQQLAENGGKLPANLALQTSLTVLVRYRN